MATVQRLGIKSLFPNLKITDKIAMGAAFVLAFFFFSHPDLWETANHSYLLLESVFRGEFFDFYNVVAEHQNAYYYLNHAHYNIFVYLLFALWELPVFLFNAVFGFALNEIFLIYWAKLLSVGFFVASGFLVGRICDALHLAQSQTYTAVLLFLFHPIAFFGPMLMGQYDSLSVFFMLWAILFYLRGDTLRFSLVMGLAALCKFFPLLVFVPLLLLAQKRLPSIAKYTALALAPTALTTLLFLGRTGEAGFFTQLMVDRMFALTVDTGGGKASVFVLFFAIVAFFAYLHTPQSKIAHNKLAIYLCMTVFGVLFLTLEWHPQWLVFLVPFLVITTCLQTQKAPWFLLDIAMSAGFFLHCFYRFPRQLGANLLDGGLAAHLGLVSLSGISGGWQGIDIFLNLIPYLAALMPVLFAGALLCHLIFKLPLGEKTLADSLCLFGGYDAISVKLWGYILFMLGLLGVWLLPTLLEACNALGVI